VPNLSGERSTAVNLPVDHDTSPDASSESDEEDMVKASRRPNSEFSVGSQVGVIVDQRGKTKTFLEQLLEGNIAANHIGPPGQPPIRPTQHPGRAETDRDYTRPYQSGGEFEGILFHPGLIERPGYGGLLQHRSELVN
jgi:hypothetical protein